MNTKHSRKLIAGVLSAAVLVQGLGALPLTPPLQAAAANIQTIQTRIFEYDFGAFKALYDTKTGNWFTPEGVPIKANNTEQRLENPRFGNGSIVMGDIRAFLIDTAAKTFKLEMEDGSIVTAAEYKSEAAAEMIAAMFAQITAITPEYDMQYYDRAQQLYVQVPKPERFPLTYVWSLDADSKDGPVCTIMFGENEYGTCIARYDAEAEKLVSVDFTKAGTVSDTGSADAFTDAGDISIDGVQDISDAVLSCRIVAEITGTRVSQLGYELADKDGDGFITGNDTANILYDVVSAPAAQQTALPAGAVAVVSQTKQDVPYYTSPVQDFTRWNQTAESFGYESGQALFDKLAYSNSGGATSLIDWQIVEGSRFDTVRIAYSMEYGSSLRFEVTGLTVDADGALNVTGEVVQDGDTMYPVIFVREFKVQHGALPQITGIRINPIDQTKYSSVSEFEQDIPAKLWFNIEEKAAETIAVTAFEMRHDDLSGLQRIFGDLDGVPLETAIMQQNTDTTLLAKCTENADGDVWDFAYRQDDLRAKDAWINALTLNGDNLYIHAVKVTDQTLTTPEDVSQYSTAASNWIQFRMTVPHGALPASLAESFVTWRVQSADDAADTLPAPELPVIFRNTTPENAIVIPNYLAYRQINFGETVYDYTDPDALLEMLDFDTTYEELANGMVGMDVVAMKKSGGTDTFDNYAVLLLAAPGWHGWNHIELESLDLRANGKFTLTTREYSVGRKTGLTPDSRFWAVEFGISVPKGSLPENITPAWSRTAATDFAVPEVTYISQEVLTPADRSEGIYAAVQYDTEYSFNDAVTVPEDVRTALGSYGDFTYRQYTDPSQTDDPALKAMLEQGKDAVALYVKQPDSSYSYGAIQARMSSDGELFVKLAEYKALAGEASITYGRLLLTAPDGYIPEVKSLETLPMEFYEEQGDNGANKKRFEDASKDPVFIEFYQPDGLRAEVMVLDGMEDSGMVSVVPEDILTELDDGLYDKCIYRQYFDESDTDDATLKGILAQGKDVLAFYMMRADGGSDFGVMRAYMQKGGKELSLLLGEHRDAEVPEAFCAHSVLLITEDGKLPQLDRVNVNFVKFEDTEIEVALTEEAAAQAGSSFTWVQNDTRPEFEKWCVNPVYIEEFAPETVRADVRISTVIELDSDVSTALGQQGWYAKMLRDPADTDDENLRETLADKDVLEIYYKESLANRDYGVTAVREDENGILQIYLASRKNLVTPPLSCAAFRILLVTEKGALPDYKGYHVECSPVDDYIDDDGNEQSQYALYRTWVYHPLYIEAGTGLTENAVQTEIQHSYLMPDDFSEREKEIYQRLKDGESSVFATHSTVGVSPQQLTADDTKDTYALYFTSFTDFEGDSLTQYGALSGEVDADGVLALHLASFHPVQAGLNSGMHRIVVIASSCALPELTGCTYDIAEVYDELEWVSPDSMGHSDDSTQFAAAIQNPLTITAAPQNDRISVRSTAGTGLRYDDRTPKAPEIHVEGLQGNDDSYSALEDSVLDGEPNWQHAILSNLSWNNGTPDLENGYLLSVIFTQQNFTGTFAVEDAALDADNVLHLTLAHCESAAAPLLGETEGETAVGIVALTSDSDLVFAAESLELTWHEYDNIADYLNAAQDLPVIRDLALESYAQLNA